MTKRSGIIVAFVVAFLLWGFAWPLVKVYLNRRAAESDQQVALSSLRMEYPKIDFEPGDVAGYTSSRAHIRVLTAIEPQQQIEIRRLIEARKADGTIKAWIWLHFMPKNGVEVEPVQI